MRVKHTLAAYRNGGPPWVDTLLAIGCDDLDWLPRPDAAGAVRLYGIEWDSAVRQRANAEVVWAVQGTPGVTPLPFPQRYFHWAVICDPSRLPQGLDATLVAVAPLVAPDGHILLKGCTREPATDRLLAQVGFRVYDEHSRPPALFAVRAAYDPIKHARAAFQEGRPERGYLLLCAIPDGFLTDPEQIIGVEAEKQLCLLAMDNAAGTDGRLARFAQALFCFYLVVSAAPAFGQTYLCQAEFWRRLGDRRMARRLLRCFHTAYPEHATPRLPGVDSSQPPPVAADPLPEVALRPRLPRLLFVMNPDRPDYGLDVLCDGLFRALGPHGLVEFPWKPTLHGRKDTPAGVKYARYPCFFDHPGEATNTDEVLALLGQGKFDAVIYADLARELDPDLVRRLVRAAGPIPLVVVDQQDDPQDNLRDIQDYLHTSEPAAYFKRELLACLPKRANTHPLPFAYPESYVIPDTGQARTRALFWAGHRQFGLRRLYLEHLERILGDSLTQTFAPDDYARVLHRSRIGLSLCGAGFDTIRYWELPAHGCMLLAERPPIRIPGDFVDGESAALFDDPDELVQKLRYYLAHPAETDRIAAAGRECLMRCHTGTARAGQFLAALGPYLEPPS